ncbi:Ankyrin repeat domain-containing protein 6, partial [Fragariocoptes setiger]
YGDTPLHTAARYGHAGVARILISARANVSQVNKNHDTPLHIAAAMGRRKLTKILMQSGCDPAIKNKQNETAMDIALRKNLVDIQEIIANPPPIKRSRSQQQYLRHSVQATQRQKQQQQYQSLCELPQRQQSRQSVSERPTTNKGPTKTTTITRQQQQTTTTNQATVIEVDANGYSYCRSANHNTRSTLAEQEDNDVCDHDDDGHDDHDGTYGRACAPDARDHPSKWRQMMTTLGNSEPSIAHVDNNGTNYHNMSGVHEVTHDSQRPQQQLQQVDASLGTLTLSRVRRHKRQTPSVASVSVVGSRVGSRHGATSARRLAAISSGAASGSNKSREHKARTRLRLFRRVTLATPKQRASKRHTASVGASASANGDAINGNNDTAATQQRDSSATIAPTTVDMVTATTGAQASDNGVVRTRTRGRRDQLMSNEQSMSVERAVNGRALRVTRPLAPLDDVTCLYAVSAKAKVKQNVVTDSSSNNNNNSSNNTDSNTHINTHADHNTDTTAAAIDSAARPSQVTDNNVNLYSDASSSLSKATTTTTTKHFEQQPQQRHGQ